jgi:hypothetical protein
LNALSNLNFIKEGTSQHYGAKHSITSVGVRQGCTH